VAKAKGQISIRITRRELRMALERLVCDDDAMVLTCYFTEKDEPLVITTTGERLS
jgi:hypothetical protein